MIKKLEMLKENPSGLTIAQMKEKGFDGVNSAHLVALLIESVETEIEVVTTIQRKVQLYIIKK